MKRIYYLLSLLLIFGCSDSLKPLYSPEDSGKPHQTKSQGQESFYYWYKGERIPLTINLNTVNIALIDNESVDKFQEILCDEYGVDFRDIKEKNGLIEAHFHNIFNDIHEYDEIVDAIRKEPFVQGVYPYFERGNGALPIGTSDLLYLRLRDVSSDSYISDSYAYDLRALQQIAEKHNVRIIEEIKEMPGWFVLSTKGSDFNNSIEATNLFFETGLFADVDPAFMFKFSQNATNDPSFSQQWALKNTTNIGYDINVEGAWAITKGAGSKIAIVDQGVDSSHDDLATNCTLMSYNCQNGGSTPSVFTPGNYHGTHVAGIMVAEGNNNLQIAGVAYESKLMRISHSLNVTGNVSEELARGISWAWSNGAEVINCSWGDQGGLLYNNLHSTLLESAITNSLENGRSHKGCIVVFAAGNKGQNGAVMDYPGTFDDRILTVGSIGRSGYRSSFSGYGSKLDVVAPGENILSTMPENSIGTLSGTSMAAPHVSGIAALILAANRNLTGEAVVRIIEQTAKKINTGIYTYSQYPSRYSGLSNQEVGYGLVDAAAAVRIARDSNLNPPYGSPSLDYYITQGAAAQYDDWYVMGGYQSSTAYFSLRMPQINSSYSYYWHFTTSGDSGWNPTFNYVGNDTGVEMNIPRPNSDSVLNVSCEIYNGSTHICTATLQLTVRLSF